MLPDADFYEMTMKQSAVDILTVPGGKVYPKTRIWGYDGMTPGPLIRVKKGRYTIVRHINGLELEHPTLGYEPHTSVHLHGSCSLPEVTGA